MVPVPLPVPLTANVCLVSVKFAVTLVAAVTVTVQTPVPLHAPLHPVKEDPVVGAAVRVTWVPCEKESEQVAPQSMAPVFAVTVPVPFPVLVTASA